MVSSASAVAVVVVAVIASACGAPVPPDSGRAIPLAVVRANDNRKPAGLLTDGRLELHLVVRMARWYPEAPDGPYVDVAVVAEEGKEPQIPAPLIRVSTGTKIVATVRNALLDSTIYVSGLGTRPLKALDSIPIKPGETRAFEFDAGEPGTYYYSANPGLQDPVHGSEQQQSAGALVVDSRGSVAPDRIFVMNVWADEKPPPISINALAINGKSWPFTERISATVGDSLRWRIVNPSTRNHPMHLHGFYFRVDAHGDGMRDSLYASAQRRLVVTEDMTAGNTMYMVWTPDRPGNWLFHCHLAFHVTPGDAQLSHRNTALSTVHNHSGDALQHMAGLILGIDVRPPADWKPASRDNVRHLNLFVDEGHRRGLAPRAMGFVLQTTDRPPALDSILVPGSVLVLRQNEPTDITIVNRLPEPTAIHWHGVELESYSDGVAGWSGTTGRSAPMIAPGDSFTAHLTLPRAGTFMYHTHINDVEQITSGLYGAIVVLPPNAEFDPSRDHVIVAGWDSRIQPPHIIVNGDSLTAAPIEIAAGVPHRFRFVNIGPAQRLFFAIRRNTEVVKWRRVAKDGADLPPSSATVGPAIRRLGVGETFDAEFTAPAAGEYLLTVGPPETQTHYSRRIIVR